MNTKKRILALYLDAPLQSWGYQSRFDRRTSFSMPTRSGIIGMICAAMGIDRSDTEMLTGFSAVEMTILAFRQYPRLTDFHTVGGGWNKKSDPLNIVSKTNGSPGDTNVTRREFLQDSKFGVLATGPEKLLSDIHGALIHPRWGIWLGRKSCVPASPVCQGFFDSEETAVAHLSKLAGGPEIRRMEDAARFEDGNVTLNDVPVDFYRRTFAPRRIIW